jgi:hypothetical protein
MQQHTARRCRALGRSRIMFAISGIPSNNQSLQTSANLCKPLQWCIGYPLWPRLVPLLTVPRGGSWESDIHRQIVVINGWRISCTLAFGGYLSRSGNQRSCPSSKLQNSEETRARGLQGASSRFQGLCYYGVAGCGTVDAKEKSGTYKYSPIHIPYLAAMRNTKEAGREKSCWKLLCTCTP